MTNNYVYDAEGRVVSLNGSVGYIYDAEGRRVAKVNGGVLTNQYLLGLGGEQITELDGNGNWMHSNVYAAGKMLATYDNVGLHFQFSDWLGSRRVQADGLGNTEKTCSNLPYGDNLFCSGPGADATEHHFTGKERDTESGLDYFGARYYASSMGRLMSPDDGSGVYASPADPQSWNLYGYVENNPLVNIDPDGHDCLYLNSDNTLNHWQAGDCTSDTDSGYYVNGSISTIYENSQGQVTGYSGTSYDTGNLMTGTFASSLPYGPLEGPDNLAGAAMIGAWEKPIGIAWTVESMFLPIGGAEALPEVELGIGGVGASRAAATASQLAKLKSLGTLEKAGAAAGKGAEIRRAAGGAAEAKKEFDAVQGALQIRGDTQIKTLSDGSRVVFYNSSSGSEATLAVQNAAGATLTKIRF